MLQVADRERCLAGRDYDDRDVNVVGQLDVVVWRLHVVYIKTVYDGGEYSTVSHASGHAISTCERCFFFGRMLRPSDHTGKNGLFLQDTSVS